MRVLVTGRDGQLAQSLARRLSGFDLIFAGRPELDLAAPETIAPIITRLRPAVIVNAAAYTAVDRAEDEPEQAHAINAVAPAVLAAAARHSGAALVQLSTDYVFDGSAEGYYTENAPTAPLGVYGRTKLAGEEAVRESGARHAVLRTAWVYSPFGQNFARTMLRLAAERERLGVVADQHGCPTSALDLADAIGALLARWRDEPDHGANATYHLAGTGETSWAGFAQEIMRASAAAGGPAMQIDPITTRNFPTRARRPANSRLDSGRFAATFGVALPPWQESVHTVVRELVA